MGAFSFCKLRTWKRKSVLKRQVSVKLAYIMGRSMETCDSTVLLSTVEYVQSQLKRILDIW